MKRQKPHFLSRKLGTSYAISAVIITITTITLVIVASNYAYQLLEQQRGASEFEVAKKSFLAFDDAVRDVSWDLKGARTARFTVNYGLFELMPNDAVDGLNLTISLPDYPSVTYSSYTGYVRYMISTRYVTLGREYKTYLLGDNETVVSQVAESLGQALIEQESGFVNITFNYRVRALRTSLVQVGNDTVNYVDMLIVKIVVSERAVHFGDFDVVARNIGITTQSYGPYDVVDNNCSILVGLGGSNGETEIELDSGKVVFNLIIAEVGTST
jgi:hypothetical protein